ncbi:MAG: hypothetical protein ABSG38_14070 [Spirochaetia bacterium]|jgi:hypothetical protein
MSKLADVTIHGTSRSYSFEVYSTGSEFDAVGAVYVFLKSVVLPNGKVIYEEILYIGQTSSLKDRVPNHEIWLYVSRNGGNCIGIHRDDNEKSRLAIEADLVAGNQRAATVSEPILSHS